VRASDWLELPSTTTGIRQEGLRALTVVGSSQFVKLAINVLGTLILVRLLAPQAFGLAAMTALVMNLIFLFKDFGFGTAVVQSVSLSQRQASTIFWMVQCAGLVLAVFSLALAPLLAWFFSAPELGPALLTVCLGFPISAFGSVHSALLARNLRFASLGAVEVLSLIGGFGVSLALAWFDFGWWSLIWQRLVQIALTTIGVWVACSWRPSAAFALHEVLGQAYFSLHVTGANIASYASRNADNFLIGWFWGAAPLGLYAKAYDLLAPLNQISGPLGQVLQPLLGRLRDDPEKYCRLATHTLTTSLLVLQPVGGLMIWQASEVTSVILGTPWMPAASLVGWFGLAVSFQLCGSVLMWTLITRHRGRDLSQTTLVNSSINLCGFVLSVPYGIVAVAATYTVLGLLVRVPYAMYVCSGDKFLPRAAALRALRLPIVSFAVLSLIYAVSERFSLLSDLADWQALAVQLSLGYLMIAILVAPSAYGRFVWQSLRHL